ncbi:hypothetical protein HMPREF1531_02008 [Propionibacterium sp. oral taxon 192 str. F0372]|uniref:MGMT family protein n=1 Tax=Propionibacterium sp. oral taxon 192 TaxID=671222 RepID=UPI000352C783|nr:MGMT family protein [Propionibacterium sp. oral taxon 192]EPH02697.1 hypothetical protein HMPREF1531_02008 [Propionibacterium sp. oral taxon 192 str. F0372]
MDHEFRTELVLRCVEAIPPGQVATYGDVAAIVGCGPRIVGTLMAQVGGGVCWWRVVNRAGRLPSRLLDDARVHWAAEGTALRGDAPLPDMARARVDVARLDANWRTATAELTQ